MSGDCLVCGNALCICEDIKTIEKPKADTKTQEEQDRAFLDFDHPCRNTCSGWGQGFKKGQLLERQKIEKLKVEIIRVKEFEKDRLDDWKRIQNAEREVAELKLKLADRSERYRLFIDSGLLQNYQELQAEKVRHAEEVRELVEALEKIERAYALNGERMAHQDYAASVLRKFKGDRRE